MRQRLLPEILRQHDAIVFGLIWCMQQFISLSLFIKLFHYIMSVFNDVAYNTLRTA